MKIETNIFLPKEFHINNVISILDSCVKEIGLKETPMGKLGHYWLWEPDPVDDTTNIDKLKGRLFQQDEAITMKFSTSADGVIFICIVFSSENHLKFLELESDGPWCTVENFEPGDNPDWLENSKYLYSFARCLHAKLNAFKTVSYDDENPGNPHFSLE